MKHISLVVGAVSEPVRLDVYVVSMPDGLTRSQLKSGLKSVTVNGKPAKLSKTVKNGDTIEIEWETAVTDTIEPQNIPLDILYEDDRVVVINKKQGMVVHPAAGNWTDTLVNALFFHLGKSTEKADSLQQMRPGIVHRLDKDTSGTIITAKDKDAELWLQSQFQKKRTKKEYIAIVAGKPPKSRGAIKTGLTRDSRNRKKFTWCDIGKGKFAHTVFQCVCTYGNYSLMRLKLKTGRTHQLRVHMKYLGCPILGDPVYGKKDKLFPSATLMLHARKLGVRLPDSDDFVVFESPVPERFKKVLHVLHKTYDKERWHL